MRLRKPVITAAVLALLLLTVVMVAGVSAEERVGNRVRVAAGEVVEGNLNVGADEVLIEGTVKGDLVTMARLVKVSGTVEQDVLGAAQVLVIEGEVKGDVRFGAQMIILEKGSQVSGDLIAAGYNVHCRPDSRIGGDVYLASYQALLAGGVGGDVRAAASGLQIAGRITGNVDVSVDEPAPPGAERSFFETFFEQYLPELPEGVTRLQLGSGLQITEGARVEGDVRYTSPAEVTIPPSAVAGKISWQQSAESEARATNETTTDWLLGQAHRLLRLLAAGLVLAWLVPGWFGRAAAALRSHPWRSLGIGLLSPFAVLLAVIALIVVAALIILLLSFVTGPALLVIIAVLALVGLAIVAYLLLVFYVSVLVTGRALAGWLLSGSSFAGAAGRWLPAILGAVIAWLVTLPIGLSGQAGQWLSVASALLGVAMVAFGLGALWLVRARRAPAASGAAPEPAL